MENEEVSLLSYKVVLNLYSSICIDKSRNDACSGNVFSLFNPSSFFSNSELSLMAQKL